LARAVLLEGGQHGHRGGDAPLHVEGRLRGVSRVVPAQGEGLGEGEGGERRVKGEG